MEFRRQQSAGRRIFQPVENLARDAKRRRNDAARVARVHALGQHFDRQRAARQSPQRRRGPKAFVIAASGIESHDEVDATQPRREQFEIGGKIVAAALLAGFDHARATRVCDALRLQRTDGGKRREHRVAIVRATSAVQFSVLDQRIPWAESFAPASHLRLLVEMAIEQHRGIAGAGNIEIEKRRAAGQADDLHVKSAHRLPFHPRFGEADDAFDMAARCPPRVEVRRLRGNADVVDQLRNDLFVPLSGDSGGECSGVQFEIPIRGPCSR